MGDITEVSSRFEGMHCNHAPETSPVSEMVLRFVVNVCQFLRWIFRSVEFHGFLVKLLHHVVDLLYRLDLFNTMSRAMLGVTGSVSHLKKLEA